MKKLSILSLLLLVPSFGIDAKRHNRCCEEVKGITGVVVIDPANAMTLQENVDSPLPFALSGDAFSVLPVAGCGYTVAGLCLTIRSLSTPNPPFPSFAEVALSPQPYMSLIEVIAQFDVTFDKPFRNRPSITTANEQLNPGGTGPCPLAGGGTELIYSSNNPLNPFNGYPLGYINSIVVTLTQVSPTGFRANLIAQLALTAFFPTSSTPTPVPPISVVAGLVASELALDFHAYATK